MVSGLADRGVGLRVLTGQGAAIDTATASGRLVFGIFAALAEFERELIRERTRAGLAAARARGRKGGRKFAMTKAQVRLAMAAMKDRDASVTDLAAELGNQARHAVPIRQPERRATRARSTGAGNLAQFSPTGGTPRAFGGRGDAENHRTTPVYQRIAAQPAEMRAGGVAFHAIAEYFGVDDHTAAKGVRWFHGEL